jgi:hypothetical protein
MSRSFRHCYRGPTGRERAEITLSQMLRTKDSRWARTGRHGTCCAPAEVEHDSAQKPMASTNRCGKRAGKTGRRAPDDGVK